MIVNSTILGLQSVADKTHQIILVILTENHENYYKIITNGKKTVQYFQTGKIFHLLEVYWGEGTGCAKKWSNLVFNGMFINLDKTRQNCDNRYKNHEGKRAGKWQEEDRSVYLARTSVWLRHWSTAFMKHVLPWLRRPTTPGTLSPLKIFGV